ncbi:hypothetical protein N9B95_03565 [Candidatus Pelagibacter sp.]|nr:hypothetical protein [Candidatus Pelagibacter sp.]|tara:strand:- start:97 stop:1149 length:1053 start_codon:yes stop_codon:yes gene_type:complete
MKAVWTSGKVKKSNYKLSNLKLNFEPGEILLLCSLSDLKKKENLDKVRNFFSKDFQDREAKDFYGDRYPYGDCHLFNAVVSNKFYEKHKMYGYNKETVLQKIKDDEKNNYIERHTPGSDHNYNYIYFFDNDKDGLSPNISKVIKKSNNKQLSFFVNPSNIATSDFIDKAIFLQGKHKPYDGKLFKIKKNELVFCCIPETKNIKCKTQFTKSDLEKFDNDIDFFIKDRIKKNKLIKFKVPNGVYGIYKIKYITFNYENLRGIAEPYELLGHLIKKFNPKEGTIGHEQEKLERLFKNGTLSKYQFSRARMRSWEGDTLSGEIYSLKRKYKKGTLSKKDFEKEKNKLVLRKLD